MQNDSLLTDSSAQHNTVVDARGDSVINLVIPAGDTLAIVRGKLDGIDDKVAIHIPLEAGNKLTARVVPPDTLTNIRFNRIIFPNGKSDGPHGKIISFTSSQSGNYQLIVSHNLMAEGGLAKEFTVYITLNR